MAQLSSFPCKSVLEKISSCVPTVGLSMTLYCVFMTVFNKVGIDEGIVLVIKLNSLPTSSPGTIPSGKLFNGL